MKFDNLLITGGAGFIGSHTADAVFHDGASAWILDDLSTGSLRNLRRWRSERKFHFRHGSTLQPKLVEALARKTDAIIHLGAVVSPFLSVKKPEIVNAVNVTGTMNVLNAAVKAKCHRVVFASSSSVYGDQTLLPITEDNPLHPVTPYGASKLAGEKYCEAYSRTYGLSTIALRYFNVYGPRQSANPYSGVIAIFSKRLSEGRRPVIYGDGAQTRDFIHVSDVVRANLLALENTEVNAAFNVGTGRRTSINELACVLANLAGKPNISPTHSPARAGDISHSYADVSKVKQVLGFEAKMVLNEGLKPLVRRKIENEVEGA